MRAALDRELMLRMTQNRVLFGHPFVPRTLLAQTAALMARTERMLVYA